MRNVSDELSGSGKIARIEGTIPETDLKWVEYCGFGFVEYREAKEVKDNGKRKEVDTKGDQTSWSMHADYQKGLHRRG